MAAWSRCRWRLLYDRLGRSDLLLVIATLRLPAIALLGLPVSLLRLGVARLDLRVSLRLLCRRHRRDIGLAGRSLSRSAARLAAELAQPLLELAVAVLQLLVLTGQLPQLVFKPLDPHLGIGIVGLGKHWCRNVEQRRDRRGGGKKMKPG